MDVKYINPFIEAFFNIMPQIGFDEVEKLGVEMVKDISSRGIIMNLGIVGDVKGNIAYITDIESAKKIASKMMMGAPVTELDDMAQSAISELSNMLTANASTNLSNIGVNINISTPALIYGEEIRIKMNTDKILNIKLSIDEIPMDVNIAIENS